MSIYIEIDLLNLLVQLTHAKILSLDKHLALYTNSLQHIKHVKLYQAGLVKLYCGVRGKKILGGRGYDGGSYIQSFSFNTFFIRHFITHIA